MPENNGLTQDRGRRGLLLGGLVLEMNSRSDLIRQSGAVNVHLFPAAAELLPDSCFAAAGGDRITIDEFLRQAGVAHHH